MPYYSYCRLKTVSEALLPVLVVHNFTQPFQCCNTGSEMGVTSRKNCPQVEIVAIEMFSHSGFVVSGTGLPELKT